MFYQLLCSWLLCVAGRGGVARCRSLLCGVVLRLVIGGRLNLVSMLSSLRLSDSAPISILHRLWSSCSLVSTSCLKLVAIAVLSVGPAGSSSLLLTPTSNALGLTPLTFCHHTGTINTNLLLAALSTALNLGLVISSRQQVLFWMSTRQENGKWSCCRSDRDYWSNGHWPIRAKGWARVRR